MDDTSTHPTTDSTVGCIHSIDRASRLTRRVGFFRSPLDILHDVLNTPRRFQQQARARQRERQMSLNETPSRRARRTPANRPVSPSPSRSRNCGQTTLTTRQASGSNTSCQRCDHDENSPGGHDARVQSVSLRVCRSLQHLEVALQYSCATYQQNLQNLPSPLHTQVQQRNEVSTVLCSQLFVIAYPFVM